MRLIAKFFLLLLLILQTTKISFGQKHPILANFSISEFKCDVFLRWSILAGSSCDGIQIYRSTDSINYTEIGSINGICGSVEYEQPYDFTDNNPVKNKINYYRLELGLQGFSQIVSVEIFEIETNGYQIRPHPANNETKIYFNNNKRQEQRFILYNNNGIEVFTTTTNDNFLELNTVLLQSGIYFFKISDSANTPIAQGKLLVQH